MTVAALIQMARPPLDLQPVFSKADLIEAPPLIEQIEELQMAQSAQSRQLPERTINLYIASATTIKGKGGTSEDYFKFDRAYVALGKDIIKITTQESAFNYPFYASASYNLSISGGKLVATNAGGSVGRMPIHPMIMEYCASAFQPLWDKFQRERYLLDKMQSVSVSPGEFVFTTKPHA